MTSIDDIADIISGTMTRFYQMDAELVNLDQTLLEYYDLGLPLDTNLHERPAHIINTLQPTLLDFFENRATVEQLIYTADKIAAFHNFIHDLYEDSDHWFNSLPEIANALYLRAAGTPWETVEEQIRSLVYNFHRLWF